MSWPTCNEGYGTDSRTRLPCQARAHGWRHLRWFLALRQRPRRIEGATVTYVVLRVGAGVAAIVCGVTAQAAAWIFGGLLLLEATLRQVWRRRASD